MFLWVCLEIGFDIENSYFIDEVRRLFAERPPQADGQKKQRNIINKGTFSTQRLIFKYTLSL